MASPNPNTPNTPSAAQSPGGSQQKPMQSQDDSETARAVAQEGGTSQKGAQASESEGKADDGFALIRSHHEKLRKALGDVESVRSPNAARQLRGKLGPLWSEHVRMHDRLRREAENAGFDEPQTLGEVEVEADLICLLLSEQDLDQGTLEPARLRVAARLMRELTEREEKAKSGLLDKVKAAGVDAGQLGKHLSQGSGGGSADQQTQPQPRHFNQQRQETMGSYDDDYGRGRRGERGRMGAQGGGQWGGQVRGMGSEDERYARRRGIQDDDQRGRRGWSEDDDEMGGRGRWSGGVGYSGGYSSGGGYSGGGGQGVGYGGDRPFRGGEQSSRGGRWQGEEEDERYGRSGSQGSSSGGRAQMQAGHQGQGYQGGYGGYSDDDDDRYSRRGSASGTDERYGRGSSGGYESERYRGSSRDYEDESYSRGGREDDDDRYSSGGGQRSSGRGEDRWSSGRRDEDDRSERGQGRWSDEDDDRRSNRGRF